MTEEYEVTIMDSKAKKEIQGIIGRIALERGISESEVRAEMQKVILFAYNNPNPETRNSFEALFGDKIPSAEEFIYTVSIDMDRDMC